MRAKYALAIVAPLYGIYVQKSGANGYIDTVTTGATLDKIKMASDSARLAKVRASIGAYPFHGQCPSIYYFAG